MSGYLICSANEEVGAQFHSHMYERGVLELLLELEFLLELVLELLLELELLLVLVLELVLFRIYKFHCIKLCLELHCILCSQLLRLHMSYILYS